MKIKVRKLKKFLCNTFNIKKILNNEKINLEEEINKIKNLNGDKKFNSIKELFNLLEKAENKTNENELSINITNVDMDDAKSVNVFKENKSKYKNSEYLEDFDVDNHFNKFYNEEKDELNLTFENLYLNQKYFFNIKYNKTNFNVIYKNQKFLALIKNNTLYFYKNEKNKLENDAYYYIYLKEYDYKIFKNQNNNIVVMYYNDGEYEYDNFELELNEYKGDLKISFEKEEITNIYKSLIYASLHNSHSVYSVKKHPIGKIKITLKLKDKDLKDNIVLSDGGFLKINFKFINPNKKIFIIPIYSIFQKITFKIMNKEETKFKIRVLNILNNIIFEYLKVENSTLKLQINNYCKPFKYYFKAYPGDNFEGISKKKSIRESKRELKLIYFRIKRIKSLMKYNLKKLKSIFFFRFPILSYIFHFFNIYILIFYSFLQIIYIYVLLGLILNYFYRFNPENFKNYIKNNFMENKYYKKPILKSLKQVKENKFRDFKNIELMSDDNTSSGFITKIKKMYDNINKVPNFFSKIISFIEKLKNTFIFTDPKKSLLIYGVLLLLYLILKYFPLNYIIILLLVFIIYKKRYYYEKNYWYGVFIFKNEIIKFLNNEKKIFVNKEIIFGNKFNKLFSKFLEERFFIYTEPNYWDKFSNLDDIIDHLTYSSEKIFTNDVFYYNHKFKFLLYYFVCSTPSDYYYYLNH